MTYKLPPKFQGDGRHTVACTQNPIGANSIAVSRAQAQRLIRQLYESKNSNHSDWCGTLWVLLEALHYNMTPYTLHRVPGLGARLQIQTEEGEVT